MNVSKQELDALTRAVICEVGHAQHTADVALFLNSKDQMEIADRTIDDIMLRVIGFRDKHKLPAIIADEQYREKREQATQKKCKELSDRLKANQQDIERLQQHNNRIQAELDKLQQEST